MFDTTTNLDAPARKSNRAPARVTSGTSEASGPFNLVHREPARRETLRAARGRPSPSSLRRSSGASGGGPCVGTAPFSRGGQPSIAGSLECGQCGGVTWLPGVEQDHPPPTSAEDRRGIQPRGAAADDDQVVRRAGLSVPISSRKTGDHAAQSAWLSKSSALWFTPDSASWESSLSVASSSLRVSSRRPTTFSWPRSVA